MTSTDGIAPGLDPGNAVIPIATAAMAATVIDRDKLDTADADYRLLVSSILAGGLFDAPFNINTLKIIRILI